MNSKLLFVLMLVSGALMLNSCSKDKTSTTANIFFTANINGTATSFNTNAGAVTASSSGQTFTTILGQAKDGTTLAILLVNTPTSGKVYSDAAADNNDKPLITITPPGTNADTYLNDDDNTSTLPTVTITSITSTTITGTFSGLVEGGIPIGNNNTLPTDAITSGKFSLKYSKQ